MNFLRLGFRKLSSDRQTDRESLQTDTTDIPRRFVGGPQPYYKVSIVTESAFRLNVSEADLPRIPVHPISYDDAKVLLE